MPDIRLYLGIERINLSDTNWNTLIAAMQAKGANQDNRPNYRNHWRPSLDDSIIIFESLFDSAVVDVDWFTNWLASEFSVDPLDIGEATGYNQYGRFSTFSYPDGVTNRFRVGVFGFVSGQGWPSWSDSHSASVQYVLDNRTDWDIPEIIA